MKNSLMTMGENPLKRRPYQSKKRKRKTKGREACAALQFARSPERLWIAGGSIVHYLFKLQPRAWSWNSIWNKGPNWLFARMFSSPLSALKLVGSAAGSGVVILLIPVPRLVHLELQDLLAPGTQHSATHPSVQLRTTWHIP